jgi:hypothetical protein
MNLDHMDLLSFEAFKAHEAHQWAGVVDLTHPLTAFYAGGDGGSLEILIGIQYPTPARPTARSMFVGMENFYLAGELHDLDLEFPDSSWDHYPGQRDELLRCDTNDANLF